MDMSFAPLISSASGLGFGIIGNNGSGSGVGAIGIGPYSIAGHMPLGNNDPIVGSMLKNYSSYNLQNPPTQAGLDSSGLDYSMSLMAIWYEFGNRGTLVLNASSIDLSQTTQAELGITDSLEPQLINLFDAGINSNSLTFGRIWITRVNDTQFRIQNNEFNFEYRSESSFARNTGTFFGGLIFGRFYESHPPYIPYISRWNYGHGGGFDVEFLGTVTIPR
jgi:hypothetical protein